MWGQAGCRFLNFLAISEGDSDSVVKAIGADQRFPPYDRTPEFKRNEDSSLDVRQKGDRLIPLVMSEYGAMGAHFKAYTWRSLRRSL